MGVLSNNYTHIVPGALISASYVSDIYDVLMGTEREDIMLSGSLNVTGSIYGNLIGTASNAITASYVLNIFSSSFSDSSSFAYTASYIEFINVDGLVNFSSSIHSRTLNLENFSSSLDDTFVNIDELNSATSSLSSSIDLVNIDLQNLSSSLDNVFVSEIEFGNFTGSYISDSSSFDMRILDNSSSIYNLENFSSSIDNVFVSEIEFGNFTGSYTTGSFTGSFAGDGSGLLNIISSSYSVNSDTASFITQLNQNVTISGSVTVLGGATIFGSSSFTYVTASQLAVSTSYISVNVFEPLQRFGGLYVYDSGSSNATASITWDSLNDRWVYTNATGSLYEGAMLLAGPKNYNGLGNEQSLTKYFVARSDGDDHLNDTQIYSSGSITIVTGSLIVTSGITGSLFGTASVASNANTASYVTLAQTASYVLNAVSSSYALISSNAATASGIQGAAQYLPYWTGTAPAVSNTLSNSSLFQDGSGNILIGTTGAVGSKLYVANNVAGQGGLQIVSSAGAGTTIAATHLGTNSKFIALTNSASSEIFSISTLGKMILKGSHEITGSLSISGSITGSAGVINSLTSSYAMTASYTPNALVTASVSSNTITFTKGDGTTFPITVNTGSSTGATVQILDEGVSLTTSITSINFIGANVTASAAGSAVTVQINQPYTAVSSSANQTINSATPAILTGTAVTLASGTWHVTSIVYATAGGNGARLTSIMYYNSLPLLFTTASQTTNSGDPMSVPSQTILTTDGVSSFDLRARAAVVGSTVNGYYLVFKRMN
jgi:hypothetical protein